ncbi:hypothetical protein MSG28_008400 [Choristoneura fumiferana]|uniref:Uncharacterized protein n=1 Tax=Choristoneura fumiferana TaxID=7141 RepID=A0ACC0J6W5_CHOFU|nr:hypothetical protein MSG28_008400 [Choristoneura fumiferana]
MWVRAKWLVLWSLWAARLARQPTAPLRVSGGRVRGSVAHDGSHAAYLGIPYASLTEDNRFQAPGPEPTWKNILDAVDDKTICPQPANLMFDAHIGRQDETGCLTINVYTPVFPSPNKRPVMVFIHGGGFKEGSGTPFVYGANYLVEKDVILVTFNYRLDVLGFLSLGIKEAPGNAGMKDQVAALKWVRRNIGAFGGDPDNVTIFGESAGAASVSYHLLSPMSAGLFHKAIAQSGSSISPWAHQRTPEYNARIVAKTMGYNIEDPYELYKIFKNTPADELVKVKIPVDVKKVHINNLMFSPTVEKVFDGVEAFLTKDPYQLLLNGEYHKVPMIIGSNDEEGYFFTGLEENLQTIDIAHSLPNHLLFPTESERKRVAGEIEKLYMENEPISESCLAKKKLSRFYGEPFFNYPSMAETELLLNSSNLPVYHYLFKYDGWRNAVKLLAGASFWRAPGATHADDLFYLFYHPLIPSWFDTDIINKITTLWTNFAKYSNPTPTTTQLLPLRWRPVNLKEPQAFVLDKELSYIPMWNTTSLKHWKKVYSKYRNL